MAQTPADKLESKTVAKTRAKAKDAAAAAGAKVPADHQSPKADVVDTGKGTVVEFQGQEYTTVLSAEEVGRNLDLMDMLSEGNILPPMKRILGPAQWVKFKNDFRDPETGVTDTRVAGELFEVLMTAMKLGNS